MNEPESGTLPETKPTPLEGRCTLCRGVMSEALLLDGRCMPCWRETALEAQRVADSLARRAHGQAEVIAANAERRAGGPASLGPGPGNE